VPAERPWFDAPWALHASVVVLVVFWGLAFVAIKQALDHMSWVTLTFLRLGFAGALFLAYLLGPARAHLAPRRADLPLLLVLGFLGFTGYHAFLNLGEADPQVTAGTAALIIASAPAFIALLAVPFLKEKISPVKAGGISLAFAGLALMIFFASPGSEYAFQVSVGGLAIVPSALFAALFTVLGKGLLRTHPPFALVGHAIFLGTLLMVPLVIADAPRFLADLGSMGAESLLPVLYLAVFPTFVAYGLWFRALERLPAASAGAYIYLSTLVGIVGGILILGEDVSVVTILGGGMVVSGVVLAQQLGKR